MIPTYTSEMARDDFSNKDPKRELLEKSLLYYEEEIVKLKRRLDFLRREYETLLLTPFSKLEFKKLANGKMEWACDIIKSREELDI